MECTKQNPSRHPHGTELGTDEHASCFFDRKIGSVEPEILGGRRNVGNGTEHYVAMAGKTLIAVVGSSFTIFP